MNTKRRHRGTATKGAARKRVWCGKKPYRFLAVSLCVLIVMCAGCGVRPRPVTDQDVSPVQLPPRSTQEDESEATPSAPQYDLAERQEQNRSPATAPVVAAGKVYDKPEEPLAKLPRQQAQNTEATNAVRGPAPQQTQLREELEPARTEAEQEPQPLNAHKIDMPLLEQPGAADELVTVNFDGVDVRDVLKTVGEITGINFIPHESVSGTITVMSPTPIRLGEIYGFLQSILDVHGYAAIETENAVKIVPKAEAAKSSLQVRIGADPAHIPKNDAVVTQIMPLKYAAATDVSQIVEPILSSGSQMTTYAGTNSIMITDTSANIHHVAQIIARLDVEGSREKVLLFPLTHASAQILSEQITQILEKAKLAAPLPGRTRPTPSPDHTPRILPDDRTNSLIVIAGEQDVETIRHLVEQLDIRRPTGTNTVHVTYLKNADANEVAVSLESVLASMRLAGTVEATQPIQVAADGSTNSLIVLASPQDFEVISEIADKLDIVREQVLVEMQILEVTEEALTEIGVDWATLDDAVEDSIRGFGLTNLGPRVSFLSGNLEGLALGAWSMGDGGVKIGAILQALEKESGVNILSTPHILTSNHRKATIIVGENRPFVVESRITETDPITPTVIQKFEYKDVGITLEITPHVSQGGMVRLEVDSEFTKLIEDVTTPSPATPTTAKRAAQTVVTMESGATVVIGGLIRDDTIRVEKKVPVLGDLPILGALFTSQRDLAQKTNLLFFITPHVMDNQEELLDMTNRKREEMPPTLGENR